MRVTPALRQELERLFDVVPHRSTADELCIVCPQPGCGDQTGNRSVNLKTGKTNCFRCNQGGNVIAWASRIGIKIEVDGATGPLETSAILDLHHESTLALPPVKAVELPRGFTLLADAPRSCYTRFIRAMAERKNLLLDDFVEAGAGFTRDDPLWEPFCIFPVVEHGIVVYYQGRTYIDEPDVSTKKFPSRRALEYGARYWLYNIDALREPTARVAVVVESILNVLSLRWKLRELGMMEYVPVAVFKHRVSAEQWLKLNRISRITEVCLLFDHDATGLSWTDGLRFSGRKKLSIAEMPPGENDRKYDPNDDVEAAIEAIRTRKPFASTHILTRAMSGADNQRPFALNMETWSSAPNALRARRKSDQPKKPARKRF